MFLDKKSRRPSGGYVPAADPSDLAAGEDVIRVCNVDEEGRFGGPERRIVQVARALRASAIETTVVYPRLDSDRFGRYIAEHGVDSIEFDITRLSRERKILARYVLRFPLEIAKLSLLLSREQCDIVHVNGAYQFKVAIAARLLGLPTVWHLNDTATPAPVKSVFGLVAKACATGFIVAGKRVRSYYLVRTALEGKPCEEIHAPVNLDVFDPRRFNGQRADRNQTLRIGTVSGITPTKGLESFVDMTAALLATRQDLKFIVAGAILKSQKSYFGSIQRRIKSRGLRDDQLDFLGLVDDVPAFLHGLDICVFTSIAEASPTSIWEAMAMGKPIVTTDVGSVRQYVEHGVSGFIVPVGDVKELVSCVQRLIVDEELRSSMGKAARMVATRSLGVDAAAAQTAAFYRRILPR